MAEIIVATYRQGHGFEISLDGAAAGLDENAIYNFLTPIFDRTINFVPNFTSACVVSVGGVLSVRFFSGARRVLVVPAVVPPAPQHSAITTTVLGYRQQPGAGPRANLLGGFPVRRNLAFSASATVHQKTNPGATGSGALRGSYVGASMLFLVGLERLGDQRCTKCIAEKGVYAGCVVDPWGVNGAYGRACANCVRNGHHEEDCSLF